LNPIEPAFSKLKALLQAKAIRIVDVLWKALADLCDSCGPRGAPTTSATTAISSQCETAQENSFQRNTAGRVRPKCRHLP
jgi:hypothetical protein